MVDACLEKVNDVQKHHSHARSTGSKHLSAQNMAATTTRSRTVLRGQIQTPTVCVWTNPPPPRISQVLGTIEAQFIGHVDATGAPG